MSLKKAYILSILKKDDHTQSFALMVPFCENPNSCVFFAAAFEYVLSFICDLIMIVAFILNTDAKAFLE